MAEQRPSMAGVCVSCDWGAGDGQGDGRGGRCLLCRRMALLPRCLLIDATQLATYWPLLASPTVAAATMWLLLA